MRWAEQQDRTLSDGEPCGTSRRLDDEYESVFRWRFCQFRRLGFPNVDAFLLTTLGADHHAARRLLALGATLGQVCQILL